MRIITGLVMVLVLLGLLVHPVYSFVNPYNTVEIKNGGTITGKVTLKGPAPEPRVFPIVLYPFGSFCKQISDGKGHVLLREFYANSVGGLKDAVVAIQDVRSGKKFRHIKNKFLTKNCMFHPADVPESEQFELHKGKLVHVHPLVGVMENHQPLYVLNKDPIIHNGQVYQKETGRRVINFPIPVSDQLHGGRIHLDKGMKVVQMICGMHEFMQTWGWIVDNPYYEKTRKGGGYTIDQIPPGTYRVTAWHPHMKPIVKEITVPPNGTVKLDFEFDSKQVVRPPYESQERFRIGPESHPFADLKGCEGPFCVRR